MEPQPKSTTARWVFAGLFVAAAVLVGLTLQGLRGSSDHATAQPNAKVQPSVVACVGRCARRAGGSPRGDAAVAGDAAEHGHVATGHRAGVAGQSTATRSVGADAAAATRAAEPGDASSVDGQPGRRQRRSTRARRTLAATRRRAQVGERHDVERLLGVHRAERNARRRGIAREQVERGQRLARGREPLVRLALRTA